MLRLNFVSPAERELVTSTYNATELAPSELMHSEQTMQGVLEHWAAIQPDAPALVFEARPASTCMLIYMRQNSLSLYA